MASSHQQSHAVLDGTRDLLDAELHRKEIVKHKEEKKKKLSKDLSFILMIVGLLSAVITAFMLYVQPLLDPDPKDEIIVLLRLVVYDEDRSIAGGYIPQIPELTPGPAVLFKSEYILYGALTATISCGAFASLVRLASALNGSRHFRWLYFKLSPVVVWMTILCLWIASILTFVAIALQLPVVVDSKR